jgi:hypothetical protein
MPAVRSWIARVFPEYLLRPTVRLSPVEREVKEALQKIAEEDGVVEDAIGDAEIRL